MNIILLHFVNVGVLIIGLIILYYLMMAMYFICAGISIKITSLVFKKEKVKVVQTP